MGCVLVVDDAATVRQQVTLALRSANVEVFGAEDAESALAIMERPFDIRLIIVDLNLPGISGFEFIDEVVRRLGDAAPPMLVLTTEHSRALVERARRSGAVGWLTKPVPSRALIEAANRLMR